MTFETDTMTQPGANRLKRIIEEYWMKRGKTVNVWVETCAVNYQKQPVYVARSNIGMYEPK